MKKSILLFLALALPALIFVFLKYAGKNEFTVPVFHEEGAPRIAECSPQPHSISTTAPYIIDIGIRTSLGMNREANVLIFPTRSIDFNRIRSGILDEIGEEVVWFGNADNYFDNENAMTVDQARKCIFFLEFPAQSVLIDKQGRIRGYYNLSKLDEIDRLRVELKIVLKKY